VSRWWKPVASAALDVAVDAGKTWLSNIASEHARRFADRRWGPAPKVEATDPEIVPPDKSD
jgi:hypothetical protein